MFSSLAGIRKALVAALGVTVTLLQAYHAFPFLPGHAVVGIVLGVLTVLSTWLVPNKKAA